MSRRPSNQPTDGELEILRLLWDLGPLGLGQICQGIRQQRQVATTTVATVLKVMLDKGLVERNSEARPYVWRALATRERTMRGLVGRLLDQAFDGSAQRLVTHLIQDGRIRDEDRREIQRLLDDSENPEGRHP